jgi:hypothetical protein
MLLPRKQVERPVRLRVCKLLKAVFEDVHLEWSPLLVSLVKVFIYGFIDKHSDLTRMLSKALLKRVCSLSIFSVMTF